MTKKSEDLTVDGPGSPISLDKFLKSTDSTRSKDLTVLIDNTGQGIAQDAPETVYVKPEDCSHQAKWFAEELFDTKLGGVIPDYLYKYLFIVYYPDKYYSNKKQVPAPDPTSAEYKFMQNLIRYCKDNAESAQLIGLIQLLSESLRVAQKYGAGIRFYIDRPETGLHPKRQASFMSMFNAIREDYGLTGDKTKL